MSSPPLQQIALRVFAGAEIIPWNSPCGINCSYATSFLGPAYECIEVGPVAQLPVNLSQIAKNVTKAPDPLGTFASGNLGPDDNGLRYWAQDEWTASIVRFWMIYGSTNHTILCTLYNATYNLNVTYINNMQSITPEIVRYNKVVTDNLTNHNGPQLSYMARQDPDVLTRLNLMSIHQSVVQYLNGWITLDFFSRQVLELKLTMVPLWKGVVNMTPTSIDFTQPLTAKLEQLLQNVTISLHSLQDQKIPIGLYAANSTGSPLLQQNALATIITQSHVYAYSPVVLWQAYGIALLLAWVCVAVGCYALYLNGVEGRMSFSQVLVTTRNATLDKVSEGANLGGQYITKEILETRVGFGQMRDHACFGVEDEIVQMQVLRRDAEN